MPYDAEDTRRRIFLAAADEFAERGLAGARVDRIAAAARANKQAIYLYYGSKEKLFAAVVRAKLAEVGDIVDVDPDAVGESVGRLFDWHREHPELIRLLLWEALETYDEPDETDAERRDTFRAKARRFAGGETRVRAAQDLLFTIMGLVSWNFAVPRTCRLVLDEPTEEAAFARRRATVIEAARALTRAAAPPTGCGSAPAPRGG
ncbi:TetR/AcrR family transcriptional regulator [Actinoplanes subtropicus]|uniref:TetR/AcrR family transcriptional regulator n=1 Tax=Actinoplanes subtropicus TaxID=543632 RepID=UPI00069173DF|nr:TetR family transcriptional regulator [Actinoplanes subtropicus]